MIHPFRYQKPRSAEEAYEWIQLGGLPVAGGTDLVPLLKYEVKAPPSLVDVSGLSELQGIRKEGARLFVGAAETLTAIARDERIRERFSALSEAAGRTASPQIRNLGTLGGNIMQDRRCIYFNQSHSWRSSIAPCFKTGGIVCHQAPASKICRAGYYSDTATALYALDAAVQVLDGNGRWEISIRELCETHGTRNGTIGLDHLLLEGVWLPLIPCRSRFLKVSVRQSIDFPTFNCAVAVREDGAVRLAIGAVREAPVLLEETMEQLTALPAEQNGGGLISGAVEEIRKRSVPVVEAAVTVRAKRESFARIDELLRWVANARRED